MIDALLQLELIDSPVLMIVGIVATILFALAVWIRPQRPVRVVIGAVAGVVILGAAVLILQARNWFDGDLPGGTAAWVVATGVVIGGSVAALTARGVWRKVAAVGAIAAQLLVCGIAVNELYGVTHTPAAIFGLDVGEPIELPSTAGEHPSLEHFAPNDAAPASGRVGHLTGANAIPSPSDYHPRAASVYLPPAALGKNPPKLPVIVMMMGQPGSPDPTLIARALDQYAQAHHGVAPIAVVIDQLGGDPSANPLCVDSQKYGSVATYANVDVVSYIKTHLNVSEDSRDWTIAGYSNGGSCALAWAAEHPDIWGNLLDVSGNEYPGSENEKKAIADLYHGDVAAYEEAKPAATLEKNAGKYDAHFAVVTWGDADKKYGPGAKRNAELLLSHGFTVETQGFAHAGHTGAVVIDGLTFGVTKLADHLGLSRFS